MQSLPAVMESVPGAVATGLPVDLKTTRSLPLPVLSYLTMVPVRRQRDSVKKLSGPNSFVSSKDQ